MTHFAAITVTHIAVYAAVISTISIAVQLARYVREKASVKLHSYLGIYNDSPGTPRIIVDVTNVGKQAIVITNLAGRYRKLIEGSVLFRVVNPKSLPKKLESGETVKLNIPGLDQLDSNLHYIYVTDSTGKEWKLSRANLRKLLKSKRAHEAKDTLLSSHANK